MTALATPGQDEAAGAAPVDATPRTAGRSLEVRTIRSDELRASVSVHGSITVRTCPVLLGVLGTHVRAGRRHLLVDLGEVGYVEESVLEHLLTVHDRVQGSGGLLLFDGAVPAIAAELRTAGLLVSSR